GFLHAIQKAPSTPLLGQVRRLRSENSAGLRWPSLESLVKQGRFLEIMERCLCVYVLNRSNAAFLQKHLSCPVTSLILPLPTPTCNFNFDEYSKTKPHPILHLGQYMRNYSSFFSLMVPGFQKTFITLPNFPFNEESHFY